ncbi:hypothetical protein J5K60_002578 [Escherichia coli]|uniref:hypothetical protein n=1 Tax=Escherichia TaxID=561 RepID=UPI0010227E52|nr:MULTISPECIES: hypothetical protein [Escherichia]ECV9594822.1 hypothetical protein [Salmonella enterica subsp. enterica serovar Typhimurium]EEQ1065498.1 hypothetical protein [Salmonella enterica]EGX7085343.1 hypothetical protein [Salmonella enterica subsp. enterica serovar 4:i:-]EKA7217935.1 hypothetical protein [Salmonella enterica subsp. enterica serovar Infantis]EKB2433102.1 hypothetical protein [Salmonella enterica subsp. enterica serovar Enteritidis]
MEFKFLPWGCSYRHKQTWNLSFYRGDVPTATINYALIMAKKHRFVLTKNAISSKTNYRASRNNVSSTVHYTDFSTNLPEMSMCGRESVGY